MKLICVTLCDAIQVQKDAQYMLLSEHGIYSKDHSTAESRLGFAEAEEAKGWRETGGSQASWSQNERKTS